MNKNATSISLAEKMVDSQEGMISFRDVVSKVFLRPKLFLFALIVPAMIAVYMAAIPPLEWAASTKILIRYSASDNGLLQDLVTEGKLGLSGATSAELIKSTPVLEDAIRKVGITEQDIYKKPSDLITDKISGLFGAIFPSDNSDSTSSDAATQNNDALVKSFKASLESSSKKSSKGPSIEILEKTSQQPEFTKLDELITLEVKSFNRTKVADMANGLAAAFIDEYYRLYAEGARQQYIYIDGLVQKEEASLEKIEQATPADLMVDRALSNSSSRELASRDVPMLSSMSNQLMVLQTELTKTQQLYAPNSPKVTRLKAEVETLKFSLNKQERIEVTKQLLEQLKAKRYQALNTESIYKNRLVPISIVENAVTPTGGGARKIIRLVMSAVIGLVLGGMLAVGLMVILNVLDPRIHFKKDVESLLSKPIVTTIPKIKNFTLLNNQRLKDDGDITQGMWQLITKVGQKAQSNQAKVITVTSSIAGEGASTSALALALNLAKNKNSKVALIDANFINANLSQLFKLNGDGLVEAISGSQPNIEYVNDSMGFSAMGAGHINNKNTLGYYAENAEKIIAEMKANFDYIVIDAGSTLKSNEALVFGAFSDETLIVATSGFTRKGTLQNAVNLLETNDVKVTGIIFNQAKEVLPAFIYRLI